MPYHRAIRKEEVMQFAGAGIELKSVMPRKINQTQNNLGGRMYQGNDHYDSDKRELVTLGQNYKEKEKEKKICHRGRPRGETEGIVKGLMLDNSGSQS